jgi:hypothetical protein
VTGHLKLASPCRRPSPLLESRKVNAVEKNEQPSVWDLRLDLVSSRALLWVVTASGTGKVRREVHQYLSDRYQRLAIHHNARGRSRRAARLWTKARRHFRLGGGGDIGPHPPKGALAMPIPEPPTFLRAVGFAARRGGSGDAA